MKKKIGSVLLLVLMLSLFASCKSEAPASAPQEAPGPDLSGIPFKIIEEFGQEGLLYKNSTVNSDLMISRIRGIEQKYDCTVKVTDEYGKDAVLKDAIIRTGATGQCLGDMAYTVNWNMASYWANDELLVPYSEVSEIIDYEHESGKYGNTALFQACMVGGEVYEVFPVALPGYVTTLQAHSLFAVNEDIIHQNDLTDPREDVEKGDWNWQTFETRLNEYTIGTGEDKISGAWEYQQIFLENAVLNNGVRYLKEIDGVPQNGVLCKEAIDAIDWVKNLIKNSGSCLINNTGNYWAGRVDSPFFRNKVALALFDTEGISLYVTTSDAFSEFGIVPFPWGPAGEYGKPISNFDAVPGMSMLLNSDLEPEDRAVIISELFEPFDEYPTMESIADHLLQTAYYDKRDVDWMLSLYKDGQYFYWTVGNDAFWSNANDSLSRMSGTEIVETYGPKLDVTIEKYILPNYGYLSTH